MEDQRLFYNGVTRRPEVTLDPVIYHDTIPPTQAGWTVWDVDWNGTCEHFPTYSEAASRYEDCVAKHMRAVPQESAEPV